MKKLILALVSVAAFFWIVGSAGALEQNNIGLLQFIIQGAIGAGVEYFALKNLDA